MTEQIVECGSSLGKEYESASNVINSGGQDKEKILDLEEADAMGFTTDMLNSEILATILLRKMLNENIYEE